MRFRICRKIRAALFLAGFSILVMLFASLNAGYGKVSAVFFPVLMLAFLISFVVAGVLLTFGYLGSFHADKEDLIDKPE